MRNILLLTIRRMYVTRYCFTRNDKDYSGLARIHQGQKALEEGESRLNWLTLRKMLQQLSNVLQSRASCLVCELSFLPLPLMNFLQ